MLVKDTRTLAASELHYIEPAAAALADRLRNPAHLAAAVKAVAADHGDDVARSASRLLRDCHFIVVHGEKALSLLIEGGRCRVQAGGEDPFGTIARRSVLSKSMGAAS
jgi:hypothetical protein